MVIHGKHCVAVQRHLHSAFGSVALATGSAWTLATGQAHVNRALYSDPDILKKFPHFPILLKSIETANPRPKLVKYGDATLAMQDAAYGALQDQLTPEAALSGLQSKLESLTH